jgi:hypothetical protein
MANFLQLLVVPTNAFTIWGNQQRESQMPRKVQQGTSRPTRFYFFLNNIFSTTHKARFSSGNSMAQVTRFYGLQLEMVNHGIFLGNQTK